MICPTCSHDNLPGSEQCENCGVDLTQLDRPTAHDRVEKSLMEDQVSALKPHSPVSLPPDATVANVIQTMLKYNIGAVLIVDNQDKLVGIFSERDLLSKVAGFDADYAQRHVSEFMTPNPESVRPTDTLAFALHKMDIGGYRHLPVMKDGRALGVISVRDLLRHFTRLCQNGNN